MILQTIIIMLAATSFHVPAMAQSSSPNGELKIPLDLPKPAPSKSPIPDTIRPGKVVTTPGTPAESPHKPGSPGTAGLQFPLPQSKK